MNKNIHIPTFIKGGISIDDRGSLTFVNDFNIENFKRFYTVRNHTQGFVRAWHGHLNETKAIMAISGTAIVAAVEMTSTKSPDKNKEVYKYVVSSSSPGIVLIPAGFANGFKTLAPDTVLLIFSSSTLEESTGDDYRFPYDYWDPWYIEQR
jgi:dTDP-4-dehydrorhamnose 3,5-epimerase-like enzyme